MPRKERTNKTLSENAEAAAAALMARMGTAEEVAAFYLRKALELGAFLDEVGGRVRRTLLENPGIDPASTRPYSSIYYVSIIPNPKRSISYISVAIFLKINPIAATNRFCLV